MLTYYGKNEDSDIPFALFLFFLWRVLGVILFFLGKFRPDRPHTVGHEKKSKGNVPKMPRSFRI